jgi:hypothetical protein
VKKIHVSHALQYGMGAERLRELLLERVAAGLDVSVEELKSVALRFEESETVASRTDYFARIEERLEPSWREERAKFARPLKFLKKGERR